MANFEIQYDAGNGWRYLGKWNRDRAIELAQGWADVSFARWDYRVVDRAGQQVWPKDGAPSLEIEPHE